MDAHVALAILDLSHPGEVRRHAVALASSIGMSPPDAGRVALVATEMATNIIKHAGKGKVLLRIIREVTDASGIEILALDQGPGMADLDRSMQDGYSTAGSPGTGLGAISRMASFMDIYSPLGKGTAVLARILPHGAKEHASGPFTVGAIRVPIPGETACGDDGSFAPTGAGARVLLADGLGHGEHAARAASEAVRSFQACPSLSLVDLFARMHAALLPTRGAAVSVAELDLNAATVQFIGVGNVSGFLAWPGGSRRMITQNGTVGLQMGHSSVFTYPWHTGCFLVMHTDGLYSHTSVDNYPGLLARHPSLVAGVLYRDFARGRDDAAVVVVTESRTSP